MTLTGKKTMEKSINIQNITYLSINLRLRGREPLGIGSSDEEVEEEEDACCAPGKKHVIN